MQLTSSFSVVTFLLLAIVSQTAKSCFWPDGTSDGDSYLPCASAGICCKKGDLCLDGPLCKSRDPEAQGAFYRPNCRTSSWTGSCKSECANGSPPFLDNVGDEQSIGQCDEHRTFFYCKNGREMHHDCKHKFEVFELKNFERTIGTATTRTSSHSSTKPAASRGSSTASSTSSTSSASLTSSKASKSSSSSSSSSSSNEASSNTSSTSSTSSTAKSDTQVIIIDTTHMPTPIHTTTAAIPTTRATTITIPSPPTSFSYSPPSPPTPSSSGPGKADNGSSVQGNSNNKTAVPIAAGVASAIAFLLGGCLLYFFVRSRRAKQRAARASPRAETPPLGFHGRFGPKYDSLMLVDLPRPPPLGTPSPSSDAAGGAAAYSGGGRGGVGVSGVSCAPASAVYAVKGGPMAACGGAAAFPGRVMPRRMDVPQVVVHEAPGPC